MREDFGGLVIEQAIVHSVPDRPRSEPGEYTVELSDDASRLSEQTQSTLERRLIKILNSRSCSVTEDAEPKSPLPEWVRDFMAERLDLVGVSGHLARHLQDCQTARNSRGLLLVASVRVRRERGLLLVKLEQETGMQVRRVNESGRSTFDVQYLANLLFTEKANVFKLALFMAAAAEGDLLQGWAADRQRTDRGMAGFFLYKYLGCRFTEDPAEVTARFHDVSFKWVNSRLTEPADSSERINFTMAVLAELQSTAETINPREFTDRHLRGPHRTEFLTYLEENGVSDRVFTKDTERIDTRLQKMRVEFANGAFLVAPLETVDDTVTFEAQDDGTTKATVQGEVTGTSGFRPPGNPKKKSTTDEAPGTGPAEDDHDADGQ